MKPSWEEGWLLGKILGIMPKESPDIIVLEQDQDATLTALKVEASERVLIQSGVYAWHIAQVSE